jgi:hypothetical protein
MLICWHRLDFLMSKLKIITPKSILIEQTASQLAAVFFEAARSSDMKKIKLRSEVIDLLRFKNDPKRFAKRHLEKFIPDAVKHLLEILGRETTPVESKELIYQAILERTNDEQLDTLAKSTEGRLPEFEQTVLYKPDNEKPKPIIIKDINSEDASRKT